MPGQLADLAALSEDYFAVPISRVAETESLLTMMGGRILCFIVWYSFLVGHVLNNIRGLFGQ